MTTHSRSGSSAAPHAASDLPVDAATLYPEGDGFFERRAKARRAKLLAGLEGALRLALGPGETVRYAARGVLYHALEYAFAGAAAQYHNITAIVLTDRRLLLIQLDRRGRAADLKNEVPLAAIAGSGRSLFGWRLRLADGKKLSFVSLRSADRKRLDALLPRSGAATAGPSMVHLCPACLRPVPGAVGAVAACPSPDCRVPFRDPRKAARLSAAIPGLGDLYLRHHLFGSIEFLGSMAMLGLGAAFALGALLSPDVSGLVAAGLVLLLLVGLPRLIDHRLTLFMGRKGIVPLALAPAPGGQVRNLPAFPRWSPLLFVAGVALAGALAVFLGQDLRLDAAAREAARLAEQERFDDALARWREIERSGGASEERRVRLALALLEAGDLVGSDILRAEFEGTRIDGGLVDRWNAAFSRERKAFTDFGEGVQQLVEGEAAEAWPRIDGALDFFRKVKRPHLPATRAEVNAHLAMGALSEPLAPEDVVAAERWLDGAAEAPAGEVAALAAAHASARGDRQATRTALARLDPAPLPAGFALLVLEARARSADGDAERGAIREAARGLPREELTRREAVRRAALAGEPSPAEDPDEE